MKTEQEIRAKLAEIDSDSRYHYPSATIVENAPLALIQTGLESQAQLLAWILEVPIPKQCRKRKVGE